MKEIKTEDWMSEVLQAEEPTIVYFWATWCQPCKMQAPALEKVMEQFPTLKVVKVNADEETELVDAHKVSSIPTLVLYKQGEVVWTLTGAKPAPVIVEKVQPYV